MNLARQPVWVVPKGSGREASIANGESLLREDSGNIRELRKYSLHYRKLKSESFYLRSEKLLVWVKESPESETRQEFELGRAIAWTCRSDWCIRWKRSKKASYLNFRLGQFNSESRSSSAGARSWNSASTGAARASHSHGKLPTASPAGKRYESLKS